MSSSRRAGSAGVGLGALSLVLYIGATIASAVDYKMTEAAGLPIDGPPAAILLAGSIAMGLGFVALVLLVLASILHRATRRSSTTSSQVAHPVGVDRLDNRPTRSHR